MRIATGTISLTSERRYECRTEFTMEKSAMTVKSGAEGISQFANLFGNIKDKAQETGENTEKDIGKEETLFTNYNADGGYAIQSGSPMAAKLTELENIRMQLMERILNIMQLLFGERSSGNTKVQSFMNELSSQMSSGSYQLMTVQTSTYTQIEEEHTAFTAEGKAMTADGRELSFNINVNMSRSFTQAMSCAHLQPINLIDPLVINVGKGVTEISDQTFTFDLDADGNAEEISSLGEGSGFLAYDKNGDGIINDGSELFGAVSGDGFSELATYDEDSNNFIDEGDSIYEKLKIWCKDNDGNDTLMTLKEADVGAIYLGRSDTQFTSQGSDFRVNAMYRQSGIFLRESTGEAGVIHQIDMAKMA